MLRVGSLRVSGDAIYKFNRTECSGETDEPVLDEEDDIGDIDQFFAPDNTE